MVVETFNPSPNHKWTGPHPRHTYMPHHNSTWMAVLLKQVLLASQRQEVTLPLGKWGPTNHQSYHPSFLGQG